MASQPDEGSSGFSALKMFRNLGLSASAACIAEATTLPLDTAKVRLQLQKKQGVGGAKPIYTGPLQTVSHIARTEGPTALFKGLEAGLHRQLIFTGLRLGLYKHIQDSLMAGQPKENVVPIHVKIGSAVCTSIIGISLANPSDVVKVRTQAASAASGVTETLGKAAAPAAAATAHTRNGAMPSAAFKAPPSAGTAQRLMSSAAKRPATLYTGSALYVYPHIIRTEGIIGGLYAGYVPNMLRNSIISTSEIISYDLSKTAFTKAGVPDGPGLHMLSGVAAGLVATVLGSPMDIVSTRIMIYKERGNNVGMMTLLSTMLREEGVTSFYKGFIPNFVRIGSFNVVLWMSLEQLHAAFDSH